MSHISRLGPFAVKGRCLSEVVDIAQASWCKVRQSEAEMGFSGTETGAETILTSGDFPRDEPMTAAEDAPAPAAAAVSDQFPKPQTRRPPPKQSPKQTCCLSKSLRPQSQGSSLRPLRARRERKTQKPLLPLLLMRRAGRQRAPGPRKKGAGSWQAEPLRLSEGPGANSPVLRLRAGPGFIPTKEMEEAVFAPDSEEVREENMGKLRDMISALGDLDARLKASVQTPQESPRGSNAGEGARAAASGEDPHNEMGADYGESDDEAVDVTQVEECLKGPENSTSEEMARLVELMAEQQSFLQQLLQESAERQAESNRLRSLEALLEQVMQEQGDAAVATIGGMRPADLLEARDLAGMTALHWAAKLGLRPVVFRLLDKCPELANVATSWYRQPPHWTPLMIIADQPPARLDERLAHTIASSMSQEGLNVRSGTYATATHLAAARGNIALVKIILWRLNDLGGKPVGTAHLKLANQMAGALPYLT